MTLELIATVLLDDRQTKLQREVVDARHGVNFVMVRTVWAVCVVHLSFITCSERASTCTSTTGCGGK